MKHLSNFISIDYEEFERGDYSGVEAFRGDEPVKVFYTDDVEKDWDSAISYLKENGYDIGCSSTIDNFLMDNDGDYEFDEKSFRILKSKKP